MTNDVPLIKRFLQYEGEFLAYLMAITRDLNASEEIYQNAAVVVMENAIKGEVIRDFRAWSKEVVRRQALKYLRNESQAKHRILPIEPALLDELTRVFMDSSTSDRQRNHRTDALRECIQEVAEPVQRKMLAMRYEQNSSFREIGDMIDKTEGSVQRALSRLRKQLHDCVRSKLALHQS